MNSSQNKKVIIILGPTGVGKTGLSILLAKKLNTEIISADSMQVYRHMDIGTAKPSPAELRAVPHHLINILSPEQKFSVGLFREKAVKVIDNLHDMGKIPLMVGGTGLYIRSLTRGLFEGPGADDSLRKKLEDEEKKHGRGHLYNKLFTIDPDAAEKINPSDTRRVIRALEVSLIDGNNISESQRLSTIPSDYDFLKIGLLRDRKELYKIIEDRVDGMIEKHLLDETKELLKLNPNQTALQALGYKEMQLYIDGHIDMDEAVRLIKKRTKMYAKRQFTWFKKELDITWVDISGIFNKEIIYSKVLKDVEFLKKLLYRNVTTGDSL
jgi:tRNA dimethylallyltransferase